LSGFTGRKGRAGGPRGLSLKPGAQPRVVGGDRRAWRPVEGCGIPGVVVKCVEIGRNTRGESGILGRA
jgi:hypothetical protein